MRAVVILLCTLAGCYAPSYRDCEITCTNACPSGLECRDNVCRVPGITTSCSEILVEDASVDGPPDDRDGDSILNDKDNCPDMRNLDQANEDTDMFGDVCDPCPPFKTYQNAGGTAVDANMDGDGD